MAPIFPPPNTVPIPSAVEGIEVYRPAEAESQPHQEIIDFKCPQCGATTSFSAGAGMLTCPHCGYTESPEKPVAGRRAEEFEFTVETLQRASQETGEERKEVECQNCGARTTTPVENLTHTCPFCGSNKVIQRALPEDLLRPRFLVPFSIEAAECRRLAQEWLGSSWMTPAVLKRAANIASFTGVYLPFWTFDSNTTAQWKAEVGHTRTEHYHENGKLRTRTRTVWRWESGRVELSIDDLPVAGTSRLSKRLSQQIQDFGMSALHPYEAKFLAGFQALAYDIPLETAWETGRAEMREQTRQACLQQASSSQIRNFSMSLDFSDETWRYILLPVYLAGYTFEQKPYQVMVNGQTGSISGQRPVDWTKVWLAVAAVVAPGLLLVLAGLLTLAIAGAGVPVGGLGFVLLVIGSIVAILILKQAYGMDDA